MVGPEQITPLHSVSVVVPVYNVERYLDQCLASIRSSLGHSLQLIIVDDGSTDASREIAGAYVERTKADPRPDTPDAILLSKENGGYGSAGNYGIAHADGQYIGIVEPDDYLDGDQFGALYDIAQKSALPDVVKATYKRVWMPDTPEQRIWCSLLHHRGVKTWQDGTTDLGESPLLVRWHPSVWSAIYRKDFLDATDTRFIEYPGAGWVDNPFVMRAMCQAERIAFTDDAWYCYREDRPGSSTVTKAPELSLIRWQEMHDEVERSRWARDEGVQASLCSIGFRYLGKLWDSPAFEDGRVHEKAIDLMRAMDPRIACSLEDVSPAAKRRYLAESHQAGEADSTWAYRRAMIRELLWSWRECGFWFACERAGLHRHPVTDNGQPNA